MDCALSSGALAEMFSCFVDLFETPRTVIRLRSCTALESIARREDRQRTMKSNQLALINTLVKLPASAPHGANHAGYLSADALIRYGGFDAVDVFLEDPECVSHGVMGAPQVPIPEGHRASLRDLGELCYCYEHYLAIYAGAPSWIDTLPFAFRCRSLCVPIITEIDCSTSQAFWTHALLGECTRSIAPTDGFVFKSDARACHELSTDLARVATVPFAENSGCRGVTTETIPAT